MTQDYVNCIKMNYQIHIFLFAILIFELSIFIQMMLFTWMRRVVWMVIGIGRWSSCATYYLYMQCMNIQMWWILSSQFDHMGIEKKGNEFISIHKEWWAVNDFIFTTLIIYFLWRVLFIQTHSHLFLLLFLQ